MNNIGIKFNKKILMVIPLGQLICHCEDPPAGGDEAICSCLLNEIASLAMTAKK